jgi:diguanylate cyclase (GGDEF)-like protein
MIDVDHFKHVNDTFGHSTGDNALRHLASLMKQELRKIDTLGRLGGEEFAIILPGATLAAAEVFAERLRNTVAASPATHHDQPISLTVSIGVTEIKVGDTCADDTLARADRALYQAKERGRNRVIIEA